MIRMLIQLRQARLQTVRLYHDTYVYVNTEFLPVHYFIVHKFQVKMQIVSGYEDAFCTNKSHGYFTVPAHTL